MAYGVVDDFIYIVIPFKIIPPRPWWFEDDDQNALIHFTPLAYIFSRSPTAINKHSNSLRTSLGRV